ncbi:uncharacterized protein PGTG_12286 [Puccinia graminis f. sp. tritici CRL 75-36-700-3]|uniref:Uncharacterized protein n=1 Tax=Puccinia graminis f. sp. tritici (strain CRL 75-36-700-3 / race SCCL) TaxID=418459 RepID=E3KPU5_PUCGT|nr:uncharacterized protein PGTG_12286 [Puccinia graminis f. sp. tritici CRL 75-36-700-3]EFP86330.1 hypothetical protein PGTG_12286 [Puccinia graminis f. sp. tritici CRL 75-36-700-3]
MGAEEGSRQAGKSGGTTKDGEGWGRSRAFDRLLGVGGQFFEAGGGPMLTEGTCRLPSGCQVGKGLNGGWWWVSPQGSSWPSIIVEVGEGGQTLNLRRSAGAGCRRQLGAQKHKTEPLGSPLAAKWCEELGGADSSWRSWGEEGGGWGRGCGGRVESRRGWGKR